MMIMFTISQLVSCQCWRGFMHMSILYLFYRGKTYWGRCGRFGWCCVSWHLSVEVLHV